MHQLHAAESQENHKKTAYSPPHRRAEDGYFISSRADSRFETDDDGTIPLMAKKRPAVARLGNF